jgi:hypothetical protein
VAIDSVVANRTGSSASVKQPLPLPEGVENSAVGGAAPAQYAARKAMSMPSPASAPAETYGAGALGLVGSARGAMADAAKGEALKGKVAEERARPEAKADRPAPRIEFASEQSQGLGDTTALREAVRNALLRAAAGCLAAGEYHLRLTIDAEGKAVRVELLASPDPASRACVERALTGLPGGVKPIARGLGLWTVTVRVTR